jgi:hypothetical protein
MDVRVCARPGCGKQLLPGRKLEDFCTYACRGQFRALQATSGASGLTRAKNTKQNKALQSLKRQSVGRFIFARINSCTYRLDRPGKLGAGCLLEVGFPGGARQQWIARVGNRASEPLALAEAKRAAVAMLRERKEAEPRDWIAELNRIAAAEVDRMALAREHKQWPCDLLGGSSRGSMRINREQRNAILSAELIAMPSHAERLSGDGFWLEFYEDGYPKLPECLRRKSAKGGRSA